jgi:hypothetical protein
MRLSVPEKVTAWNMEEMKKFVVNGPENYPGALYIIRPDGKRIRLEFVVDRTKIAEAVELGFIVEGISKMVISPFLIGSPRFTACQLWLITSEFCPTRPSACTYVFVHLTTPTLMGTK